ncbi:MAG: N-6 DNA methylase [Bacteroidales bacterium]|nr:N-6 DNA methylase [Bacteroidales bacterium]
MLDTETKRRIDTARDILVGKVPDPKSQVEQITIALIYKFMDDMDMEAMELGGERTFFSGEFEKYAWNKIFDPKVGGYELLNLYAEAIVKLNVNPNIPQLFRDIFKNAYLPYRDPETLKGFLKIIDEFTYDHSERLGDAFEYLLSVLGSQGSAGQFRTPRHIIDFMVDIIDPKKDETILDPACGTAGFLISSYKHILKHNSSNFDADEDKQVIDEKIKNLNELTLNSKKYKGDKLTPDERSGLAENIKGYDISPDMVRLSLVNMYLHGLNDPDIAEYDTLTSEDNWNKYADVILANPPFMSPKGGIRPHNRFTVKSNRSEVLFVDYIAEHLTPNGRAAVIVPEGIIFQSGKAYKQLRKLLVDEYLVGVISLPAGVFNPYSGVKTSILCLDKSLAKKTNKILFIKIENDGFDLGAQRRPIKQNDLPEALQTIKVYKNSLTKSAPLNLGELSEGLRGHVVNKTKIAENNDFNLSGERYKVEKKVISDYPLKNVKDIAEVIAGQSPKGEYYNEVGDGLPFYQGKTEFEKIHLGAPKKWTSQITKIAITNDILMSVRAPVGPVNIATQKICIGRGLAAIRSKDLINFKYLFYILKSKENEIKGSGGLVFDNINKTQIEQIQIPLPSLSVQEEIVAEIEGYQKIIDGARQVVENYKPQIKIDPEWEMVEFKNAPFEIIDGDRGINYPKKEEFKSEGYCLFLNTKNVRENGFNFDETMFISKEKDEILRKGKLIRRDVVLTTRGTIGNTGIFDDSVKFDNIRINSGMLIFRLNEEKLLSDYLFYYFQSKNAKYQINRILSGSAQPQLPIRDLNFIKISIPPISEQKSIINQIIYEKEIVNSNKKLIELYEQKIKDRIAEVWGEDKKEAKKNTKPYEIKESELLMAAES